MNIWSDGYYVYYGRNVHTRAFAETPIYWQDWTNKTLCPAFEWATCRTVNLSCIVK